MSLSRYSLTHTHTLSILFENSHFVPDPNMDWHKSYISFSVHVTQWLQYVLFILLLLVSLLLRIIMTDIIRRIWIWMGSAVRYMSSISSGSLNHRRYEIFLLFYGMKRMNIRKFNANPSMGPDMNHLYRQHRCIWRRTTGNRNVSISNVSSVCRPALPAANKKLNWV